MILPISFYKRQDVVQIARELLGKVLITNIDHQLTSGIIVETEAYAGVTDSALHAFGGRKTSRTEVMFREGGIAYVYLCYGIHSLFNVVTNFEGVPHAVLIRAISPIGGLDLMLKRAGKSKVDKTFGIGPGRVSRILGVHYTHSGLPLTKNSETSNPQNIWIEDSGIKVVPSLVKISPRIGIDYAGEDASLPYRFVYDLK